MATATRIYIVTIGESDRLVRATHPSQALMHVVRDIAAVGVASQDELVDCLADGIKVESAMEEHSPAPAPAESKTLPLPTQASYSPPEAGEDEDDEGDDELIPVATHSPRARVPAKYRCPQTGSTWSGRGVMPIWLKAALRDGSKKLEDFLAEVATA